jgi:hypothetical protein
MQSRASISALPLWLKVLYTLFVTLLVSVYWQHYGPANFLWGSDIALFMILAGIWIESALPFSMMALAVLIPELVWTADFLARLLLGFDPQTFRGTAYMFNAETPLLPRALSLYHLLLPVLLLWAMQRLGYDRRAFLAQTLLCWIVFPLSYLVSTPTANINYVFGFGSEPQGWVVQELWVLFMMIAFPLLLYLPLHLILQRLFRAPAGR